MEETFAEIAVFTIARDSKILLHFPFRKVFGRFGTFFSKKVPRKKASRGAGLEKGEDLCYNGKNEAVKGD
ncbi:MAG: hypothetical protein IKD31_05435 [Clostridia bacterium]|nr:hypothetical protein [Clostridia bacterium]